MNIDVPDEVISKLIDAEIKASISRRVTDVMNNGKANWFTEFNIMNITRSCIDMIIRDSVKTAFDDYINKLDYEQLSKDIGDVISNRILSSVFDINKDED